MTQPGAAPDSCQKLIELLQQRLAAETSLFRAQLLREDIARLQRLTELARAATDPEQYRQAGRRLGWTTLDARTAELATLLDPLLDLWLEAVHCGGRAGLDASIFDAWQALTNARLERLVGCLSTPVPKLRD